MTTSLGLGRPSSGHNIYKNLYAGVYTMYCSSFSWDLIYNRIKGKVHPCTGTDALYRPYGP